MQFEINEQTRASLERWVPGAQAVGGMYLFPSRFRRSTHLSTRQYARIVRVGWRASDSTSRPTARLRYAGREPLRIIARRATCAPFSCCSATPSSRARSDTSALRSTMLSSSELSARRLFSVPGVGRAAAPAGTTGMSNELTIRHEGESPPRYCRRCRRELAQTSPVDRDIVD